MLTTTIIKITTMAMTTTIDSLRVASGRCVRPMAAACLAVGIFVSSGGCATRSVVAQPPPADADATISAGYTLLHDVAGRNRNVHQIFMLKSGSDEFKLLIRAIAHECRQLTSAIESFAEDDPLLSLEGADLPWIEAKTRESIEAAASRDLLGANGENLQRRLSLEQIEAMRYIAHLARMIAENETVDARGAYLREVSDRALALRERLVVSLQPTTPPPGAEAPAEEAGDSSEGGS